MRIRVKFCGITRPEHAAAAAQAGADAVGLMFAEESPRELSLERAVEIADALPPFVARVGVFRDNQPELIERVLRAVSLDLLQFHGSEAPEQCRRWNRSWLKAVPMQSGTDAKAYMARYRGAAGFLLDAFSATQPGGRGKRFDWSAWPHEAPAPLILAGGLTPDNVFEAIRRTRPYGVDVSSGVESAPGIKEPGLMERFMAEVGRATGEFH